MSKVKKKAAKVAKKTAQKTNQRKSKEIERVPTGIPFFDSLIEGGFEKKSTNLLVGGPGSGKTIFATEFLVEGMKSGEACLYITFEERKEEFYKNMARFGWNLEEFEKKGLFTFLEYTPTKVNSMLEEGGGVIESIVIKNKIKRLVIDSITSFALLFEDELSKRESALKLFKLIGSWNCTSLLTFETNPAEKDQIDSRTLEFESDSIIIFYFLRDKTNRKRYLEVLKMRGTHHSKGIYRFHLRPKGIEIDKKPCSTVPGIES